MPTSIYLTALAALGQREALIGSALERSGATILSVGPDGILVEPDIEDWANPFGRHLIAIRFPHLMENILHADSSPNATQIWETYGVKLTVTFPDLEVRVALEMRGDGCRCDDLDPGYLCALCLAESEFPDIEEAMAASYSRLLKATVASLEPATVAPKPAARSVRR